MFFKRFMFLLIITALLLPQLAFADTTLVIARETDANSMDPAEAGSFEAIKCTDWMYDGLVRFDGASSNIIPALAESWPMSENGLIWTFKLRKGVKFHDGTDFNADAVVFSFERQRDKTHPYYSKTFFRWDQKLKNVQLTRKIDDYTVELQLSAPQPTLLVNLALFGGYIVSPRAVQELKDGFSRNPVGTGYFKFVKWVKDDYMEFEANRDYWDGAPKVDRLIVKVIPDNDVRFLALKKGEAHIAYGLDFMTYEEIQGDKELNLNTINTLGTSFVALNMEKKPLDDIRVRKAIIMAVNRERLFETVFYGYGEFANQTLPSNWFGHNPDVKSLPYNPKEAKKLLAETGLRNIRLDVICWNGSRPYCPSPRDMATLLKSDLQAVGIDVDIKILNWATYIAERAKGDYAMAIGGLVAGTPDPDGLVHQLWSVDSIRPPVERINMANWRNPEGQKLIYEARSIYDQEKRAELYRQIAKLFDDDAPAVFVAHPMTAIASSAKLKNVDLHASTLVPLHKVEFVK